MLYEYISHCIDCCKSVSLTRSVKKRFPHENSVTIRYCFYSLRQQPKKLIRRLHVRKQNSRTIKLRVVSLDVTRIFSCEPNILEIRSSVQQLKNKQNVRRSLFCCGILKIKHYDDTAIQKRIRGRSKRKIGYIVRERDKRRKGGNGEICAGQVGRITCKRNENVYFRRELARKFTCRRKSDLENGNTESGGFRSNSNSNF